MTKNLNNQPQITRCAAHGFTLIELLTVVVIVMLLASILVPSVLTARKIAKVGQTKMTINLLDGACRLYAADMTVPGSTPVYPPSTPGTMPPNPPMEGRHLLVECLVGYLNAAGDNADGPGFRVTGGKVVHGPYGGAEGAKTATITDTTSPFYVAAYANLPVFVDSFGSPIYYYSSDQYNADNTYHYVGFSNSDNTVLPTSAFAAGFKMPDYAYNPDAGNQPYQNTFLIISPGPDQQFSTKASDPASDDVTNFR